MCVLFSSSTQQRKDKNTEKTKAIVPVCCTAKKNSDSAQLQWCVCVYVHSKGKSDLYFVMVVMVVVVVVVSEKGLYLVDAVEVADDDELKARR